MEGHLLFFVRLRQLRLVMEREPLPLLRFDHFHQALQVSDAPYLLLLSSNDF